MAKRSVKRAVQNSRKGSNAMPIQRTINSDYKNLAMDYKKLFVELWRMPATKYILGGVALVGFMPVLMRGLRKFPQVNTVVHENMDKVLNKIDGVVHIPGYHSTQNDMDSTSH